MNFLRDFVAKKLDTRLSDPGVVAIVDGGLGGDQHPLGYDFWCNVNCQEVMYELTERLANMWF